MDKHKIAPELRGPVRRVPTLTTDSLMSRWIGRRITRMIPAAKVEGVEREIRKQAPAPWIYRPRLRRSNAALLWFHGGGYMMGAPAMADRICRETCRALGIVVISASYRFAPEHPFPAALDDAFAAWQWLQQSAASLGVDPGRIVVGGESAGGGLAAGLVQRIHDAGARHAIAQWLFCPMLDDRTTKRHELDALDHLVWSNASNVLGWRAYLGTQPGQQTAPPYAAPARREILDGLPQAWIGVGDIDLFFEEDRDYAERLRRVGVDARFVSVPGAPHGFQVWARTTPVARRFMVDAHAWLGAIVGAEPEILAA